MILKSSVTIHGGDYDCSEAVRMCYRAVGVLPYGSYMWTGNEVDLLTAHGFVFRSLSSPQVGDVLWRSGHTEMYLGGGKQGGARHGDYPSGTDGRKGDQDSTEVTRNAYRASDWSRLLRYEGGLTCDGIPCAIAAAMVMDHIIDHQAHGYSQPNRAGDGTIETITLKWDDGRTRVKPKVIEFGKPCTYTATTECNIRNFPTLTDGTAVVGQLRPGQRVKCDGICEAEETLWLHYTYKGNDRYLSRAKLNAWLVMANA